jgi:hypothetical protein
MNDTAWYLGVREKRAFDWPWQQEEASPEVPYAGLGALLGGGGLFFGSGPLTKKPLRELSTAEMRLRSAVDSLQQDIEYNKPWEAQHLRCQSASSNEYRYAHSTSCQAPPDRRGGHGGVTCRSESPPCLKVEAESRRIPCEGTPVAGSRTRWLRGLRRLVWERVA